MSLESTLFAALESLVSGRVFPDVADEGTPAPYLTYQVVGGSALNFVEGSAPGTRNARLQVNVWSHTRLEASAIGNAAEEILRVTAALQTTVLGAAVSEFEPDTGLRGQRQEFSVWY